MTPESLLSIAAGLALAAAAGFRVFVPLLVVSIAARSGWLEISPAFACPGVRSEKNPRDLLRENPRVR